jgi:hypothetical protein
MAACTTQVAPPAIAKDLQIEQAGRGHHQKNDS